MILLLSLVINLDSIDGKPDEDGETEEEYEPAGRGEEGAEVEVLLVVDAAGDEDGVEDEGTVELAVAVGDAACIEGDAVEGRQGKDEICHLDIVAEKEQPDMEPHIEEGADGHILDDVLAIADDALAPRIGTLTHLFAVLSSTTLSG